MKFKIAYLFLLLSLSVSAIDYIEIRNLFAASPHNESKAKLLMDKTSGATTSNAVLLGYRGGVHMAMANHCYLPTSKLSYFNTGKALLEQAIAALPGSVELRFIRFSIQCNVPGFLGYSNNLSADKEILITWVKSAGASKDSDLKTRVKSFLLTSKQCTEEEKTSIKNV